MAKKKKHTLHAAQEVSSSSTIVTLRSLGRRLTSNRKSGDHLPLDDKVLWYVLKIFMILWTGASYFESIQEKYELG